MAKRKKVDPMRATNTTLTPPEEDIKGPASNIRSRRHQKVKIIGKEHNYKYPPHQAPPPQQPGQQETRQS
jgi:hypothetical protein